MVLRPRHALAAAAILTDPQQPGAPDGTTPNMPGDSKSRSCADHPAALPSGAGRISSVAGDFNGDQARDQLLAYAELDAAGQPRQWHARVLLASGGVADLFVLAGCQLRQVRVAGAGVLQISVGGSVGHAEGFDCQTTDRHGRRLLTLWGVEPADQQPDGGAGYPWTNTSYRWAGNTLVRQVGTDHGGFATVADGLPGMSSDKAATSCPPSSPPGAVEAPGSRVVVRCAEGGRSALRATTRHDGLLCRADGDRWNCNMTGRET